MYSMKYQYMQDIDLQIIWGTHHQII